MDYGDNRKGIDCSFQLRDMGIGFSSRIEKESLDGKSWFYEVDKNQVFTRRNHDDPALCKKHPNYAGDWGYFNKPDIFYVGGGYSVDQMWRIKDVSWWENEELNNRQFGQVLRYYKKYKPRIVVSHECPSAVKYDVLTNIMKGNIISRTEKILQKMFEVHQPEIWIFGHYHIRKNIYVGETKFVALGGLRISKSADCIYEIENLNWEGKTECSLAKS